MRKFVEIDDEIYAKLEKQAHEKGFSCVEELLAAFAKNFSTGCSVTCRADANPVGA